MLDVDDSHHPAMAPDVRSRRGFLCCVGTAITPDITMQEQTGLFRSTGDVVRSLAVCSWLSRLFAGIFPLLKLTSA